MSTIDKVDSVQSTTVDLEITDFLPHRYPFLLVDKVLRFKVRESLEAVKNVTNNEPFFMGHFPAKSIMPGVLIIEALAQASGILIYKSIGRIPDLTNPADLFYLAGINNARFKG